MPSKAAGFSSIEDDGRLAVDPILPLVADDNSLTGRVRRYAQVSTAMGGLAARLAGERYLGLNLDRGRHAAELKAVLGGIKGPLMKVAQLLATIPDALPKEYVQELVQLQANAPAMGWPFVRRRMAGELGADWQSRFREFDRTAARAASLGQVHRATALDGTPLACKLQYPDMASAVEADLRQLKLAMSLYERYDRAVTTAEIHAEIADRLREELDYEREAAHMRLYGEILRDEPGVAVPVPIPELSTSRLLTMTWLEGAPILDIAESAARAAQRDRVAHVPDLVRAVLLLRRDPRRPASRQLHGRAGPTPSISSISAASASSAPRSCAASSTSTMRCSAATATSPSTPIRAGASAICRTRSSTC